MAGKEKVDIKRSDQFQEVDDELTRVMAELDFTIERVSAIFDGAIDENNPVPGEVPADEKGERHPPAPEIAAATGAEVPPEDEETFPADVR